MKTKNIFKALAVAMLLPAMLLTTACTRLHPSRHRQCNPRGRRHHARHV